MFDRNAVRKTMRAQLGNFETNALDHDIIWRFVNAALDAVEEVEAAGLERPDIDHVIVHAGRPVAIRKTRGRARGERRRLAAEASQPLRSYTIHPIPREEED